MATRQIATSTLWQIASQAVMAALSILTVKLAAMALSKELAGNLNSAYGYLQLFAILADFGLYAVAVREVSRAAEDQKERVLGTILTLRIGILCLSLGSALLIAWFTPAWRGTVLPIAISIAALVPFFTLLAGIIRTVFQVRYKMHYVFIAEVAQRIFTTGAVGLLVLQGVRLTDNVVYLYIILLIGGIGALILWLFSLWYGNHLLRLRPYWDTALFRRTLKAAIPYGLAFFCMALYRNFDVTLIALLRDDYEIQNAYYGFVTRMAEMGYLIPTFLLNSTLPILSERHESGADTRALLGKTFMILLLIGSISFLFSLLWSRQLTHLLTNENYLSTASHAGTDTALRLLSLPIFLNGIVLFSFYTMLTKNAWKPLVVSLLVGAVLSIIANLVLIPSLGFVGAGVTAGVTQVFLALLLLPQALRLLPMQFSLRMFGQWLLFTLLLAAGLWAAQPLLSGDIRTAMGLCVMMLYILGIGWLTQLHRLFLGPKMKVVA